MTYPQPGGYQPPAPQYPQQPPAPQYAPPQPPAYGYPPQQGGYPGQAPQGYAAPQQPYGYPPAQQGYPAPPQAPQTPAAPPVSASLSDFYNQASVGWGPSISPIGATPDGTTVVAVVAQWITKAHVEPQEEYDKPGVLKRRRNGDLVYQMKVPVNVPPGTQYWTRKGVQQVLDGRAQLYIGSKDKDLLGAAIAVGGGNPAEPPELGSVILVTKTHNRPTNGMPSPVVAFQYFRPGPEAMQYAAQCGISDYPDLSTPKPAADAPAQEAPALAPTPSAGPAVQQQAAPPPPVTQQPAPPMAPQQFASPTGAGAMVPPPAPQGLPVAAPPATPGAPAGLSPDKAALLASLTGGAPVAPPAP